MANENKTRRQCSCDTLYDYGRIKAKNNTRFSNNKEQLLEPFLTTRYNFPTVNSKLKPLLLLRHQTSFFLVK